MRHLCEKCGLAGVGGRSCPTWKGNQQMKTLVFALAMAASAAALGGCSTTQEMEARVAAKDSADCQDYGAAPERAAICNAECYCASSTSSRPLSLRRKRKRNSTRARRCSPRVCAATRPRQESSHFRVTSSGGRVLRSTAPRRPNPRRRPAGTQRQKRRRSLEPNQRVSRFKPVPQHRLGPVDRLLHLLGHRRRQRTLEHFRSDGIEGIPSGLR